MVGLNVLHVIRSFNKFSLQFWLLAIFMAIVFMTGGASRGDVQSLFILLPLSILFCALALTTLNRDHLRGRGPLLWVALAVFALVLLYVVPLPPSVWQALSSRQVATEIDQIAGLETVWRPLALSPAGGWQTLASLFAPLAVLLFAFQLSRDDLYRMLPVLIGLGALSGLFGLMQAAGGVDGSLYFYRITNKGSAVGLFANRNHAATLLVCLFPMLAVFATVRTGVRDRQKVRQLVAAAIAIVLVPLILVTGSRSGLLTSVLGLLGAAALYRHPPADRALRRGQAKFQIRTAPLIAIVAVAGLGFLTVFFARAEAIDRMFAAASDGDNRNNFWAISNGLFQVYFPWGIGPGSFADAFKIAEPTDFLVPTYLNRAHNDWIETLVAFGLPGLLIMVSYGYYYVRRSYAMWRKMDGTRRSVIFARMAGIALAIIAVASLSDYPLRTPTLMCIFALLMIWFNDADRQAESASSSSNK